MSVVPSFSCPRFHLSEDEFNCNIIPQMAALPAVHSLLCSYSFKSTTATLTLTLTDTGGPACEILDPWTSEVDPWISEPSVDWADAQFIYCVEQDEELLHNIMTIKTYTNKFVYHIHSSCEEDTISIGFDLFWR